MRNPHNDPLVEGFDTGSGTRKKHVPERRCVLSGRIAPRDDLLRLALGPGGPDGADVVMPDALAKAPGRGAWIGVSREELEQAIARGHLKGALARGFKGPAPVIPDDLPDLAQSAMTRAFTDRLGLERRTGKLLTGSDKIAETARSGRVHWLAHAADAGDDGSRRLDQAWRVGMEAEGTGLAGIRLPLDRMALSVALGRDNVVHLALTDRAAAERVSALLARLLHFLGRGEAVANADSGLADSGSGADPLPPDRPVSTETG